MELRGPAKARPFRALLAGAFFFAALLLSGCNLTGLRSIPTATPFPQSTTTAVAQVLVPTSTSVPSASEAQPTTDVPTAAPPTVERPATTVFPTLAPAVATEAQPTEGAPDTPTPPKVATQAAGSTNPRPQPTIAIAATVAGDTTTPTATVVPKSERVSIFEQVWATVKENYLYPDFHGADWQALHDKYLPIVTNATTAHDFYAAITEMVAALKDGHSRYLSPQDAREEDDLQSGNADYVGIGVLSSPATSTIQIVFVFPGSPAEKAGIQRRDKISAVDGVPVTDPTTDQTRIRGPKGSTVHLTVESPEQAPREVAIVRDTITGGIVPTGSRLPSDPDIGLLVIPDLWTDDMGDRVHSELQTVLSDTRPLKGLIMDLRGNGGGFRTVLASILGDFVTGQVGQFSNQKGHTPFVIQKSDLYDKLANVPLVILVDQGSESYTEVLAGTLQAQGRAKVVGVTSAGNTETIYRYDFTDGSRLWVAEESFQLQNGTNLEGRGVIPDVTVPQDWTTFTERDDPDILKAVQLLKK